jgi:predicted nucleic acid-binding protein
MNLVIDTNILISALIKDGMTRDLIANSPFNLLIPEQEIIEIKRHEKLISRKSGQTLDEVRDLIRKLLKYVTILRNNLFLDYREEAGRIIGKIDEDDIPFIAAALYLNCPIWSDDRHFKKQKEVKIFTTKEIFKIVTK